MRGEVAPHFSTTPAPTQQKEDTMTTQSTLGPFMTLILTLTAKGKCAANVINPSPAEVVKSLLFAQLLNGIPRTKAVGHANPSSRVFRIGSLQDCRVGL
jgi:hypothetical protein